MNPLDLTQHQPLYPDLDAYIRDHKEPEDDVRHSYKIYDSEEAQVEDLKRWLRQNRTTSFQQDLMRWIGERGMTDVEFYKAALIDRRLFSTIRSNMYYIPSRETALACCLALRLELPDAEALLRKAGYALNHSSNSDLIIEYCIVNHIYDLDAVNARLYYYEQRILRL